MSATLAASGLSVRLGGRPILDSVDFSCRPGELLALVGPNGAGKTTLIRALAGLLPCTGTVTLDGRPVGDLPPRAVARRIAYLPQGHAFHWPMAVRDVVALGRLPHGGGPGRSSAADRAAIERAIEATGIAPFVDRTVTTLSGGERARVALARVLAVEADLVLADEPTASLDPHYQLVVLDILHRLAREKRAVVAVLHDLGLAARYADRVVALNNGRVVADGPPQAVLTEDMLREVFAVEAYRAGHDGRPVIVPWSLPGQSPDRAAPSA